MDGRVEQDPQAPRSGEQSGAAGSGRFVDLEGETWYRIDNYHEMPPFLMTLVSGYDHWLFVSSTGGLTCGRREPGNALFPYCTDDKVHDAWATTGPHTAIRVTRGGETRLWRPFAPEAPAAGLERRLYKNRIGNRLMFEEIDHNLGLAFGYLWSTGDRFGFVRRSVLSNRGDGEVRVEILDGLRNILPWGVNPSLQASMSTLVDAYKQAELCEGLPAAAYSLSSLPSDRPEPLEALFASVAWSTGLEAPRILLSEAQVGEFLRGGGVETETSTRGRRGAFYVQADLQLAPGASRRWYLVADVQQGPESLPVLLEALREGVTADDLDRDIAEGASRLLQLAGAADACQRSADLLITTRHFSNALFNIMRGGTFFDGYLMPRDDFLAFAESWHRGVAAKFERLPLPGGDTLERGDLLRLAAESGDADLERIALEYLPLKFSRRHGDPSRPWNRFSIDIRHSDGTPRLNYEGNWRDIFQNWEALTLAYPEYVQSFICRFVNASTVDGYNPYHLSRAGFDWEVLDPEDPWSNIGYWGDHQVNYLAELLELSQRYHPGRLEALLKRDLFVYAAVPYRIKPYQEILPDPRNSIEFDRAAAERAQARTRELGADGKLVVAADGSILRANLAEKLLLPLLAKMGNMVPGGGIWMNTQRPEWNDANNALVGYGVSVVTLCYLRRYTVLLSSLLASAPSDSYPVAEEIAGLLSDLDAALQQFSPLLGSAVSGGDRKAFMDAVGGWISDFRARVYAGLSGRRIEVTVERLAHFIDRARAFIDHSLGLSRRADGLFHAYRLIRFTADACEVEDLDAMLEGQVAALNSGFLDAAEGLGLLEALRASALYRPDQDSYLLYPDRETRAFLDRNVIDPERLGGIAWIGGQLQSGNSPYLLRDAAGQVRFRAEFSSAALLRTALRKDESVPAADADALLELYESVFQHRRFTGRSASMYKYEGLGCIYWHMVSKLALGASQASAQAFRSGPAETERAGRLFEAFSAIRTGLGMYKSPRDYGAFPVDPYSHTPGFAGVQQPGMTGQVKEDLITRAIELGVRVEEGEIRFEPVLLRRDEFLQQAASWRYPSPQGEQRELLPAGTLGFTLCGVPVVYRLADAPLIRFHDGDGAPHVLQGTGLGKERSRRVFRRERGIRRIEVDVDPGSLR